jgi:hypothetical protein
MLWWIIDIIAAGDFEALGTGVLAMALLVGILIILF